eukprot:gnl/TRDRNA2_/TRDRNA2_166835_c2_seq1.p1 gnl/TRDRNA2_/TRDRNA2_166835_c2~~gnl/TRDRNA2_/TRDRNA2_166835_c2_seq1.p1  ORF type:complete len:204 (+),score=41.58 gnl/TRDRNA2_/TRDRNA2_166835_c2_seq1:2-613(+)
MLKSGRIYAWTFLFFIAFYGISISNILTGIFVDHAIKSGIAPRYQQITDERERMLGDVADFRDFIVELDVARDGKISMETFRELVHRPSFVAYLALIGLDIKDADMFFSMMSEACRSREIEVETFAQSCMLMRGSATAVDLHTVHIQVQIMLRQQQKCLTYCMEQLQDLKRLVDHRSSGLSAAQESMQEGPFVRPCNRPHFDP